MPKNSKARIKANNRYNEKAYDRINLAVPKGRKADIESHASAGGRSINGYVCGLIQSDMGLSDDQWTKKGE